MALRLVHQDLAEAAQNASLRGKGEAVGFASFVTKGLFNPRSTFGSRQLLELFKTSYERDLDLYS